MKIYRKLEKKELEGLTFGTAIAVSSDFGWDKTPAMVKSSSKSELSFIVLDPRHDVTIVMKLDAPQENGNIEVFIEDGFVVETTDGPLWAHPSGGEPEYPGVRVDLVDAQENVVASLSMTEYIPGGEGVCSYGCLETEEEEFKEVPTCRMMRKDGTILSESERPVYCRDAANLEVSAGFVTRAWPDDNANEDCHKRTFHIGYKNA